ncbi:hypothetical protein WJX82_010431 [Trebouxia sp. C0006]
MPTPANVDYRSDPRTRVVLIPAWNQGQCGSCWACASVACIEASYARQIGTGLPFLSVQHVLDACTQRRGYDSCTSCKGGLVGQAVRFAEREGLLQEAVHPYSGSDQKWHRRKHLWKQRCFPVLQSVEVWSKSETCLLSTVLQALDVLGPLVLTFTIGDKPLFKFVVGSDSPIWRGPWAAVDPTAKGSFEHHAVLIVGYSSRSASCMEPHFIMQNSWGAAKPNEGVFYVPVTEMPHFGRILGVQCRSYLPGPRRWLRALCWAAVA